MQPGKAHSIKTKRSVVAEGAALSVAPGLEPSRRGLLGLVAAAIVASVLPMWVGPGHGAAFAKGKDGSSGSGGSGSGSGGSGSGSSGSGSSGSGSGGSEDDEDEDDHSGHGGGSGSGSGGPGSGNSGSGSGGSGSGNGGRSGEGGRGDQELLWVKFRDGHTEQIRGGTFLRTNDSGKVVEQRRALRSDVTRLTAFRAVSASSIREIESLILLSAAQNSAQVIDRSGWTEMVSGGIYQLSDPNGNLVTRRAATGDDMLRISVMAGQN